MVEFLTILPYLILVGIIIMVIYALKSAHNDKIKNQQDAELLQNVLDEMNDFSPEKIIQNDFPVFYVALDDNKNEMFCFSNSIGVRFRYRDVICAEILIDDNVVETHKSASIGGALVGGMVAGSLGAVIGGTNSGSSTSIKKVSSLKIHILLRNAQMDSFDIIAHEGFEADTSTKGYKELYDKVQSIYDMFRLAMDKAKTYRKNITNKTKIEELKELVQLKELGLITSEEFEIMKRKMIND